MVNVKEFLEKRVLTGEIVVIPAVDFIMLQEHVQDLILRVDALQHENTQLSLLGMPSVAHYQRWLHGKVN